MQRRGCAGPDRRLVTSGTWVVLVLATSFVIIGIGNLAVWDQVSSGGTLGAGAWLGVLVPMGAVAWGIHRARARATAREWLLAAAEDVAVVRQQRRPEPVGEGPTRLAG